MGTETAKGCAPCGDCLNSFSRTHRGLFTAAEMVVTADQIIDVYFQRTEEIREPAL